MGTSNSVDWDLVAGMTLFDVDTKSIGILVRRFSTREAMVAGYDEEWSIPYNIWDLDDLEECITWVWDTLWSNDGRIVYSEDGLINLIKAGIIIILPIEQESGGDD
jgi:hypothetical protein